MKIYKFTMTYDDKPYTDAVNLSDDHTKTDQEIMQMMLDKFLLWKTNLQNSGAITEEVQQESTEEAPQEPIAE
jgi:hypothetical protein